MYVSSVCLSWPHFVQQNLLPTLTVAACFRGSIFCVESFRLCLFRETYKKLFLVLILFMKYIYIFFLIGTYRLCLYPRGGRGGWFCNLYYDIILSLLFGPEIQKALKIQVKSMKQDGYKDTTELLEKRKYIRSNRIATKYMPTPYW